MELIVKYQIIATVVGNLCEEFLFQFSTFETIVTTVEDAKGGLIQRYMRREFYVFILVFVSLICGLPLVTNVSSLLFFKCRFTD